MKKFALATKIGMTEIIQEDGVVLSVTVLTFEPMMVLEIKTNDKHGYDAIKVGVKEKSEKKCNKAELGYFKKCGVNPFKITKEYRLENLEGYEVGKSISGPVFGLNEKVNARSATIGRGFAGTIKRWNFQRGPMSHGSKSHRITGSIGGGTTPGRVIKGKKMAGRMGNNFVTIKNLKVVKIEGNLIFINGSLPGKQNNMVELTA